VPVKLSSPHKSTFYQGNIKNIAVLAFKFLDASLKNNLQNLTRGDTNEYENETAAKFGATYRCTNVIGVRTIHAPI
jgi:hypothetical protein